MVSPVARWVMDVVVFACYINGRTQMLRKRTGQ
jgi:hypothetical protein